MGPGALVAGRYMIEDLLGQGGMGAVYRAYDREISEQVALKILTGTPDRGAALERFRQELRLARKLTHRNIVRVHDLGVHAGRRFITMELLQGADLRSYMDAGALPRGVAIELLHQAAVGLQAAHDMGVVHRDVKPENLFVTLSARQLNPGLRIIAKGESQSAQMNEAARQKADAIIAAAKQTASYCQKGSLSIGVMIDSFLTQP